MESVEAINAFVSTVESKVKALFEALNGHDLQALRGLYASDARTRRPGWPQEEGVDALVASYEMDFACVPDIRFEPTSVTTDEQRTVSELRITGTNDGPTVLGDFGKALLGRDVEAVPPTGRKIDLPAAFVHEVRDGRIAVERQYWGLLEFLVQVGAVGG
jgi:ketosteroid isomerase-like protein